jgi:tellurium resistance protein TerD
VHNSFIRVYDQDTQEEFARFNLGEDFTNETGVQAGRLYRDDSTWHFEALGLGVNGGLEELLGIYAAKFC